MEGDIDNRQDTAPNNQASDPIITVGNFSEERKGLNQSQQQLEAKPVTTIQPTQLIKGSSNKHSKVIFSLVIIVLVAVLVGSLVYWNSTLHKNYKPNTNNSPNVTQTTNQPSTTSATANPYKNTNVNSKVQQNEQFCSSDPLLC